MVQKPVYGKLNWRAADALVPSSQHWTPERKVIDQPLTKLPCRAIGARHEVAKLDKSVERSVGVALPIEAAKTLCEKLADKTPNSVPFRFVYCSLKHTERSKKTLIFATDTRKLSNDLERGIAKIASANRNIFEAYTLRPASFGVKDSPPTASASTSKKFAHGLGHGATASITPERVGRAMVKIACDGYAERVIENDVILKLSN
jgi:hypothetical protein